MATSIKPKILIVDDNHVMRALLRGILRQEEYDIVGEAGNGEAALEMVERLRPDMVCLDIVMPAMSGLEVLRRIKGSRPEIVVLMISAISTMDTVRDAVEAGAADFVVKPFNSARVIATIRRTLEAARV